MEGWAMVKLVRFALISSVAVLWVGTTLNLPLALNLLGLGTSFFIAVFASLAAYSLGVVISRAEARNLNFTYSIQGHFEDSAYSTLSPTPRKVWRAVSALLYRLGSLAFYGVLYPAYRVALVLCAIAVTLWYFNFLNPGYLLHGAPSDTTVLEMLTFTVQNLIAWVTNDLAVPEWTEIEFARHGTARVIGWLLSFMTLGACGRLLLALFRAFGAYVILSKPVATLVRSGIASGE